MNRRRWLALLELGVISLSDIIVGPAIRSGRRVPVLVDAHQPEPLSCAREPRRAR